MAAPAATEEGLMGERTASVRARKGGRSEREYKLECVRERVERTEHSACSCLWLGVGWG